MSDRVAGWGYRALVEFRLAEPADGSARQLALSVGLHGDANRGALIHSSSEGMWFGKATPGPEWAEAEPILYYLTSLLHVGGHRVPAGLRDPRRPSCTAPPTSS